MYYCERQPHRAYHNLEHVTASLCEFDAARHTTDEPDLIETARWFHDAIYDPRAGDNEAQSAALARSLLQSPGVSPHETNRIEQLILATAHQYPPANCREQVIVDVDLTILGQDADSFDLSEQQIRREYEWVPESEFWKKRTQFLQSLLARDVIYYTPFFRDQYETAARANLERTIRMHQD